MDVCRDAVYRGFWRAALKAASGLFETQYVLGHMLEAEDILFLDCWGDGFGSQGHRPDLHGAYGAGGQEGFGNGFGNGAGWANANGLGDGLGWGDSWGTGDNHGSGYASEDGNSNGHNVSRPGVPELVVEGFAISHGPRGDPVRARAYA